MNVRRWAALMALLAIASMIASGCSQSRDSSPTPSLTLQQETPSPTPILDVTPHINWYITPCIDFFAWGTEFASSGNSLKWSPDGSKILFDVRAGPRHHKRSTAIYGVNIDGSRLWRIADTTVAASYGGGGGPMVHFDVSPDGSQVAYSSCKAEEDLAHLDYDIVVSAIDGTQRQKIIENEHYDNYPAWSPDGSRIAFIPDSDASADTERMLREIRGELAIYTLATGEFVEVPLAIGDRVVPYSLKWNPEGEHIAFLAIEEEDDYVSRVTFAPLAVYVTRVDGSGLTRISGAIGGPAWSPDGQRIAVILYEPAGEYERALYTFAADGSDPVLVHRFPFIYPTLWLGGISWSPDGSQLLFHNGESIQKVSVDGSQVVDVVSAPVRGIRLSEMAAWSPDGSKIAIRATSESPRDDNILLYLVDPDGANRQVLVRGDDGSVVAENSGWQDAEADASRCHEAVGVGGRGENPGLVGDCMALIRAKGSLAPDKILNWISSIPMEEWLGVTLAGSPLRVVSLDLGSFTGWRPLDGHLAPELGNLTNLVELDLSSNQLTGPVPPELARLSLLETLRMDDNTFTSCIEAELPEIWVEATGLKRCEPAEEGIP